jgi:hypothetical protein
LLKHDNQLDQTFSENKSLCRQSHQFVICFVYFFFEEKMSSVKRLSWDINARTITASAFITFESLLSHDEAVQACEIQYSQENETRTSSSWIFFVILRWLKFLEDIIADDDLIIYSCLSRH